jgi:hypothetical protein
MLRASLALSSSRTAVAGRPCAGSLVMDRLSRLMVPAILDLSAFSSIMPVTVDLTTAAAAPRAALCAHAAAQARLAAAVAVKVQCA